MQVRQLLEEDDAVSPVIGVILMVAITVILAAVIASFVLGLGGSQQKTPQASFSWDYNQQVDLPNQNRNAGVAEVSHDGGDSIRANELYVRGNGRVDTSSKFSNISNADMDSTTSPSTWKESGATASGEIGENSAVVGGNSLGIAVKSDFELSLVWEPSEGDTSATLSEKTGPDA